MRWPTARLDSVAVLDRQSINPSNADPGTRYVGLEHVDGDGRIACIETVGSAELQSNKFRFTDRHVLFGKLRPYLRKIANPTFSGVCSTDIIPVLPSDRISRDFLYYFLRTPAMVELATHRCSGANLPRRRGKITRDRFLALEVPLPPLAEQKRIAGILDAADALRAKRCEALAQLDTLLQATFLDMFGDPVTNPMGWDVRPMGQSMRIRRGGSPRPIQKYLGGNINWIKISDATSSANDIYITSCAQKITADGLSKTTLLEPGSFVFANSGVSLGFARILKIKGAIHDGWLAFDRLCA